MSVHEAIGKIISEMEGVGKNQRNKEQGYNFRGIDDVLKVVHPLLGKHGVFFAPDVLEREYEERVSAKGTVGHCTHLHVRFRVYGPEGDSFEMSTWGEGLDYGDKATNKAMTAAFKYALFEVFAVSDPADDADHGSPEAGETTGRTTTRQAPVRANPQTGEITDDPATMDLRAVTAALEALKLPVTGNLAQKRLRLAEARAGVAPANVASNGSEMITEKQIALVNTLFNEKGFPPDPAERHRYEGFIVGRTVESIHQLTKKEGHDLIEALKAEEVREVEQPSLLDAESGEPF